MKTAEASDVDDALELDTLRSVVREHPVRLAILFGSHATGATHAASDIDVAVEFDSLRPSDPSYNDVFLGLSADLCDALDTDAVDLVDLHSVSSPLATSIFEHGVLLAGDDEHATELRRELTSVDTEPRSPRERIDAALTKIDAHLEAGDDGVPATGERETDG